MSTLRRSLLLLLIGLCAVATPAAAAPGQYVPGEVVVRFAADAGAAQQRALVADLDGRITGRLLGRRAAVIAVRAGAPPDVARRLADDPRVAWAEPNYIYRSRALASDPSFPQQWGLLNTGQTVNGTTGAPGADIRATAAWDLTVGSPAVKVAVIDGGVDMTHPDLAPNFVVPANPAEAGDGREANGIDDDGNGLVDDFRGWDFVGADNNPRDDDSVGHGTHATGTIAARGNDGFGIAGVSWTAQLIAIRGLDAVGAGTTAAIAAAIAYAGERGARIANASFGGPVFSQAISDAIAEAPNMLLVAAAGNDGQNVDAPGNASFPCELPLPNIICVAASDQADQLASFSTFGPVSVDLAAPGENVFSTMPGGTFQHLDGTSFAAPHVSGAGALVLAANPAASIGQVRGALIAGVDVLPSLTGAVASNGRLNARRTLERVPAATAGPTAAAGPPAEVGETALRLTGTITPRGQRIAHFFEFGPTTAYGGQTTTRRAPAAGAIATSERIDRLAPGTTYHYRLVAADAGGITYGPDQTVTTATPPPPPDLSLTPADLTISRTGRFWFLNLRLKTFTLTSGLLERRVITRVAGRRVVRFRSVLGLRRRGFAAGEQRLPLGPLRAGRYRLTLNANSIAGQQRLRRNFTVSIVGRPRLSVVVAGASARARLRLPARAAVEGRLDRVRAGLPVLERRLSPRILAAGNREIRLGGGLAPGRYRLTLLIGDGSAQRRLTAFFRIGASVESLAANHTSRD